VRASVTIASIDSCAAVSCPMYFSEIRSPSVAASATRIVLRGADPQQWTVYLSLTALPADFIKIGDTFDLIVDAAAPTHAFGDRSQTVVLAHGSDLAVFAAESSGYPARLPDLSAFQIDVTHGSDVCENPITGPAGCGYRASAAVVTVGGNTSTLVGGQTARIDWLSFTNGGIGAAFGGFCDAPSGATVGGFRVPQP
jgi:hypothetical protein